MSKREVVALVVVAVSMLVVGFGCLATYGILREYADVCGERSVMAQVWLDGAGLGPLVAVVAVVLALVVGLVGGRRMSVAAVGLVVLALVGATISGAAAVAGKEAAYADHPATYGSCGGYNS